MVTAIIGLVFGYFRTRDTRLRKESEARIKELTGMEGRVNYLENELTRCEKTTRDYEYEIRQLQQTVINQQAIIGRLESDGESPKPRRGGK